MPLEQEAQVWSLGREDPQKKEMATHPVFLAGEFHGQKSLVSYSPWGHKESDRTEQWTLSFHLGFPSGSDQFHFHFSLSWIGEGNGNLLQCSCLENPRDGGAWWADVYGVTQIKWLSSSSSSGADSKEFACSAGDLGLILGSGRSPGKGNGYPLPYSWLENSMDRGAWWTTVSQT